MVSDEVICAFGRLGKTFGADKFGYVPDMITCAKGLTSAATRPIGAMTAQRPDRSSRSGTATTSSRTATRSAGTRCRRRSRWPTSTSSSREDLNRHVLDNEGAFRATLEKLTDLPIVGNVRGDGYFFGIELVKDKDTKETFERRRGRAAAARVHVEGAVRRRALLPRRRPRRPGRAARAAADHRPGGVRRDRADPAVGAHRGLEPSSDPGSAAEDLLQGGEHEQRLVGRALAPIRPIRQTVAA